MESDSLLNRIPSNQQLIDYLLDSRQQLSDRSFLDPEDHFQTLSLFIPNDILKSAVSMIDAKQVRKVVTVPGNRIYYEFTVFLLQNYSLETFKPRSTPFLSPSSL